MVSTTVKVETEDNANMPPLTGDAMTSHWLKLLISLDLIIVGNIWDNASRKMNKISNSALVVFGY